MSVRRLVPLHAVELSSDPESATAGEIYYNTTTSSLKFFNGTNWQDVSAGTEQQYLLTHSHTYDGDIYSVIPIPVYANLADGGAPSDPSSGAIDGGDTISGSGTIIDGGTP